MDREMALQREEVDAAAWLSARHAAIVVRGKQGGPKGSYAGNYYDVDMNWRETKQQMWTTEVCSDPVVALVDVICFTSLFRT